jgi:hypothetical protein
LESVIDRFFELLSAPDVPFRGLHRGVTEQELNLFEFASGTVAKASAGATKVVRCQVIHSDPLGISLDCCPNNIRRDPTTQFGPVFPDPPEYQPV